MKNIILLGNCTETLKSVPDGSVDTVITSPPYYGLRDYGTAKWVGGNPECPHYRTSKRSDYTITGHKTMVDSGHPVGDAIYKHVCPLCGAVREDAQVGLEETPEEYIDKLVGVFREVKRVLRDEGTLWVNIGDTYSSSKIGKVKDLIGIPWMLAFALRADGWYLRQDIIWAKPNPMPESVKDRCTKSHEYIFLLSKQPRYYFDWQAIREPAVSAPTVRDKNAEGYQADYAKGNRFSPGARVYGADGKRNKRDVWNISLHPYKGAHFATFPEELAKHCILAGSPEGGTVLDPFFGAGTVGVVARKLGRNYIGCELNPEYVDMARNRIEGITA